MSEIHRTANCSCGQLTALCVGEPARVGACHCTECQRRTGSVFGVGAYYPRSQVTLTGNYKRYARSSDAGRRVESHFCPECGTTVTWDLALFPDMTAVAVGCFADPHFPSPQRAVWASHKHDWVVFPEGVPQLEAQPGAPASQSK